MVFFRFYVGFGSGSVIHKKNKSDDPDPDETNPQHSTNKFKIETLDKNVVDRVYDLHWTFQSLFALALFHKEGEASFGRYILGNDNFKGGGECWRLIYIFFLQIIFFCYLTTLSPKT